MVLISIPYKLSMCQNNINNFSCFWRRQSTYIYKLRGTAHCCSSLCCPLTSWLTDFDDSDASNNFNHIDAKPVYLPNSDSISSTYNVGPYYPPLLHYDI